MQAVIVVLVCAGLAAARIASAAQHVVGGSQGWEASTDFDSWVSDKTFNVGDQLVFKYSALHSVLELGSETAYKSCDLGTPLNSMTSGNDVVKLTKPGTRYFACGTPGHCDQGMKVKVNVLSSSSSGTTPSSPDSGSKSGSGSDSDPATKSGTGTGSNSNPGHELRASSVFGVVIGLLATRLIWAF